MVLSGCGTAGKPSSQRAQAAENCEFVICIIRLSELSVLLLVQVQLGGLQLLLPLTKSNDPEIVRLAAHALANLAVNTANQVTMVS